MTNVLVREGTFWSKIFSRTYYLDLTGTLPLKYIYPVKIKGYSPPVIFLNHFYPPPEFPKASLASDHFDPFKGTPKLLFLFFHIEYSRKLYSWSRTTGIIYENEVISILVYLFIGGLATCISILVKKNSGRNFPWPFHF